MTDRHLQVLDLYRRHRLDDQHDFYALRADQHETARRSAVTTSASLLVLAAVFGALGAADASRRALWAFLGACASALATALAAYEAASGFDRLGRQYAETRDAIAITDVFGPEASAAPGDGDHSDRESEVSTFVADTERLLRSEIETWSQQTAAMYDAGQATSD